MTTQAWASPVMDADVVDALVLPRLVWLRPKLVGLVSTLSKLLPARSVVRGARRASCGRAE